MAVRKIRLGLSVSDIDKAIAELEAYKKELNRKAALLRERIAERIASSSQAGFNGAIVDDLLRDGLRFAEVTVTVRDSGNVAVVIANGTDAVFAEFGSGTYANGAVGSSPHPMGVELGFTIGGYGKGMGKRAVWGFKEDGELRLTHGAPAGMPFYRAAQMALDEIESIAREVFGS